MVKKEIDSEILPYYFESMSTSFYGDQESNIIKSEINISGLYIVVSCYSVPSY